ATYGPIGVIPSQVLPKLRTTIWPGLKSLALTVWSARCVLGEKKNNNKKKNKNLYNYNRVSALRA
ncbi:MAG: hypothetical protein ACRDCE_07450, partial [Cetobacterium sp.]|uniref:hypothetical protein n=1 Tax=Cetobacterium sp. TaxID=2071632 RepID=UPI003EE58094